MKASSRESIVVATLLATIFEFLILAFSAFLMPPIAPYKLNFLLLFDFLGLCRNFKNYRLNKVYILTC